MEITYQKYYMTQPESGFVIIRYTNGYAEYFTEDGTPLNTDLGWSGYVSGSIDTPSWAL